MFPSLNYLWLTLWASDLLDDSVAAPISPRRSYEMYLSKTVPDLFFLQDSILVISGGVRGIGLALALPL